MRRPRGHIQQRSEGSFRLRYTIGRDPATGKRLTATATVRGTRKDAEPRIDPSPLGHRYRGAC